MVHWRSGYDAPPTAVEAIAGVVYIDHDPKFRTGVITMKVHIQCKYVRYYFKE